MGVGSRVGGRDGWGWGGGMMRGKWRQLYLNNKKIKIKFLKREKN